MNSPPAPTLLQMAEDQGSANYLVSHKKAAQDGAWVMKPPLKRVCGENHVLCRAIEEYRADGAIVPGRCAQFLMDGDNCGGTWVKEHRVQAVKSLILVLFLIHKISKHFEVIETSLSKS